MFNLNEILAFCDLDVMVNRLFLQKIFTNVGTDEVLLLISL